MSSTSAPDEIRQPGSSGGDRGAHAAPEDRVVVEALAFLGGRAEAIVRVAPAGSVVQVATVGALRP